MAGRDRWIQECCRLAALHLAAGWLVFAPANAFATSITFEFEATVAVVGAVYAAEASVGDVITGTLTFEDSVADTNADPDTGSYSQTVPPAGFSIELNGETISADTSFGITVDDDLPSGPDQLDRFIPLAASVSSTPGFSAPIDFLDMILRDTQGLIFSGDALPASIDLADLEQFQVRIICSFSCPEGAGSLVANLDSLTVVPEPGTLVLLVTGLAAVGLRGRGCASRGSCEGEAISRAASLPAARAPRR